MTVGQRFQSWLEGLASSWKDRLRGWMVSWVVNGVDSYMKSREPEIISLTKNSLTKLKQAPGIPLEMSEMIDKALVTGDIGSVIFGWMATIIGILPQLLGLGAPLGRIWEYDQDRVAKSARLEPTMVLTAWRRDPAAMAKWFDDLRDLGWNEERITTLKAITEIIPGVQDLVRMSVREAFSPEIAERFGQYQDPPTAVYPWAEKIGLSKEWVDRYWAAHWDLPSTSDGFELLHRGIINEDTLKLLLRALDVMPYWRDQLIKLSWNIPTRIDVRRFWDMRTIDEKRLREIYTGLGYHDQDLEDYVLWTKIYVDFPDLLARYKNGWITIEDVKRELIAMGMKPDRAATLIEEKVKKAAPERVAKERDLTAAEIIKGIKKGVITDVEGAELLRDMGYSEEEAWFKITIELTAAAGSPENYADFKDLTQKWRLASGMEGKPMTEEIKKLGAEVVRLSGEVATLQSRIKEEKGKLLDTEVLPEEATARVTELQVTLHRAEAELARVKTDYNAKIAEWKHAT